MSRAVHSSAPASTAAELVHGGCLIAARKDFPGATEPFLDLSTGINPVAYPWPTLPAEAFTRLPEPEALAALQAVAARAYGVADPAGVAAGPGTQIIIHLLPRLFAARRVAILGPTYAEHAAAWRLAGAGVVERFDIADLWHADAAVVCNPNNPDGRVVPAGVLLGLADALAARGGLLVVDEAFADFADPAVSLAPALPHPGLVVLRSFGKAYGLAGVRLGFALADGGRAAAIRAALGPWAVSGPAIAIGCAALADQAWRRATAARLVRDAGALDGCIAALGLQVRGGTSLFRLGEGEVASARFRSLGEAGILVRRFEHQPRWLRFGVPGTAAAWARLRAVASGLSHTGDSQQA